MKKVITILAAFIFLSFTATVEKEYSVKTDINSWQKHIDKLQTIRQIADESNLSNLQVKFITRTIDSLQMLIIPQLQTQLKDTTKKK